MFTLINNFKSNVNINHLLNTLQNLSRRQNNKKKLKSFIIKILKINLLITGFKLVATS